MQLNKILKINHILLLAILIRLWFIVTVPTTWNPDIWAIQAHNDEPAHINYVRYLMQYGELPIQKHHVQEPDAFIRNEFEFHQPPLQYLICAVTARLFVIPHDSDALIYFCRAVICLSGIISILLFYKLMTQNFHMSSSLFLTFIYSLLPVHIRHSSCFSNDHLVWILTLILFLQIKRRYDNTDIGIRSILLEGFILGIALWTKMTAMPLLGFYLCMVLIQKKYWKSWAFPFLIGLLLAFPYFVRNIILYQDVFCIGTGSGPSQKALSSFQPATWYIFLRGFLISFTFPYDTVFIPFLARLPVYVFWLFLFIITPIQSFRKIMSNWKSQAIQIEISFIYMLFITAMGMIVFNWHHMQTEARLIFLALPAIFIIMGEKIDHMGILQKSALVLVSLYPTIAVCIFS